MATDFTANDIKAAVASSTATLLGGSERNELAKKVYDAHKAGAGLLPSFRSSIAGGAPPADLEAAFVDAAEAAKAQRLASKAAKTAATTPPASEKSPGEEAKEAAKAASKVSRSVTRVTLREASKAAKGLSEQSVKDALQVVINADAAAKAAAKVASDAAEAATRAPDDATAKAETKAAQDAFEAVKVAAEEASDGLDDVKDAVADAGEVREAAPPTPRDKAKSVVKGGWLEPRIPTFVALIVAAFATWAATAKGIPWIATDLVVTGAIVTILGTAAVAVFRQPPAGRNLAGTLAIAAIILVVVAFRFDGGDGISGGSDVSDGPPAVTDGFQSAAQPTETPTD